MSEVKEAFKNEMELIMSAKSENEGLARLAVAAFMACMNPTLDEVEDVKTAVSEAVTNAIVHGYRGMEEKGNVVLKGYIEDCLIHVKVVDDGVGIADVKKAMEPLFTTAPEEERSGMGFAFMEAFMDEVVVESRPGEGCSVSMIKKIGEGHKREEQNSGEWPEEDA